MPEETGPVNSKTDPRLHNDKVPYILFPRPVFFLKIASELIQVKTNKPPSVMDFFTCPPVVPRKENKGGGARTQKNIRYFLKR